MPPGFGQAGFICDMVQRIRGTLIMLYIETESKDAAFHFSVEEYFTRLAPVDAPVMMIWQTGNCVMLGGYQVAAAEIDLNYAQKEGIQIVRRSSGGGTIFTDSGTLLYTMITPLPKTRYPQQTAKELFGIGHQRVERHGACCQGGRPERHYHRWEKSFWHGSICPRRSGVQPLFPVIRYQFGNAYQGASGG